MILYHPSAFSIFLLLSLVSFWILGTEHTALYLLGAQQTLERRMQYPELFFLFSDLVNHQVTEEIYNVNFIMQSS